MRRSLVPTATLLICLSGCLEIEETLEVGEDGSVALTVSAHGDVEDLAHGYPVALNGPWQPVSEDALRWLAEVGPDTGSRLVQEAVTGTVWPAREGRAEGKARLTVRARFASAEEVPQFYASATEAYKSAFLRHDTSLQVQEKGGKRVYVFERRYEGRRRLHWETWGRIVEALPGRIREKLENEGRLTAEEWEELTVLAQRVHRSAARALARDALEGIYTRGRADLPPADHRALVEAAAMAVSKGISAGRLASIHETSLQRSEARKRAKEQGLPAPEDRGPDPMQELEEEGRQALRDALKVGLRSQVPAPVQNAVLERLEWSFTFRDATEDIGDDSFKVHVQMPGTIVGGNFLRREGERASWEFKGEELRGGDVTLRVISVVE